MGIDIWKPYEQAKKKPQARHFGSFKATALSMLDKEMRVWQHTNADLSECPCYAFLVEADNQKILYCTDTKLCVWDLRNQKINHMLLGIDYQEEFLAEDDSKNSHVIRGHLSLSTGCDMVKANKTNALRSVILCHMSAQSADPDKIIAEVQKAAGSGVLVDASAAGKEWELGLYPF